MLSREEEVQIFKERCGEVLRIAISVESLIDYFIKTYFWFSDKDKNYLFNDLLLYKMRFWDKINAFRGICLKEGIEKDRFKKIYKEIKCIQDRRNRVAHEYIHFDEEMGTVLIGRKSPERRVESLKLSVELVNSLHDKKKFVFEEIIRIKTEIISKKH